MHRERKEWRDMQQARVEVAKEATLEISISTLMISLGEEVLLETDRVVVVANDSSSTLEVEVTKVASSTKEDSNNNSKNNQ